MKKKIIGIIAGLLIIATVFLPVTANYNLNLGKSKSLGKSSEHFAYYSSSDELCWIYKSNLDSPYDTTCVCGGLIPSNPLFPSGTWTSDERLLVQEYSTGILYEIDLENCEVIEIGGGGVGLNGLTYDPTSGKVYGCSNYNLFEINPETGEQDLIGSFNTGTIMIEIACDAEGIMYGWDVKFSGESYLYKIDKDTGEASIVGAMGLTLCYAQDGDFCREYDILYLAAYVISPAYGSCLIECDEDTGDCNILGMFNNYQGFFVIPDLGNQKPIAEFNWTPLPPEPGEKIIFNASKSYDPDGYITLYEWDWDNDEIYDEKNYSSPIATHIFKEEGYYPVTLCVHDYYLKPDKITKTVRVGNQPPDTPVITGRTSGKPGKNYTYCIDTPIDPDGDNFLVLWNWGDGTFTDWQGPYPDGKKVCANHSWGKKGVYTIGAKIKDEYGAESSWGYLEVTIPKSNNAIFSRWLNLFPLMWRLISSIFDTKD